MSRYDIMVKRRKSRDQELQESPLRSLREEFGLSQEEFGRSIGVTARTISRWEAGDSEPTFTVRQMKAFLSLLHLKNKSIHDLPDELTPPRRTLVVTALGESEN